VHCRAVNHTTGSRDRRRKCADEEGSGSSELQSVPVWQAGILGLRHLQWCLKSNLLALETQSRWRRIKAARKPRSANVGFAAAPGSVEISGKSSRARRALFSAAALISARQTPPDWPSPPTLSRTNELSAPAATSTLSATKHNTLWFILAINKYWISISISTSLLQYASVIVAHHQFSKFPSCKKFSYGVNRPYIFRMCYFIPKIWYCYDMCSKERTYPDGIVNNEVRIPISW